MVGWPGILTLYPSMLALVIAAAGLVMVGLRRPEGPAVRPMVVYLAAITWWSLIVFTEGVLPEIQIKQILFYLTTPVWVILPTAFLLYAIQFGGLGRTVSRRMQAVLLIEPALALVIIFNQCVAFSHVALGRGGCSSQSMAANYPRHPIPSAYHL